MQQWDMKAVPTAGHAGSFGYRIRKVRATLNTFEISFSVPLVQTTYSQVSVLEIPFAHRSFSGGACPEM